MRLLFAILALSLASAAGAATDSDACACCRNLAALDLYGLEAPPETDEGDPLHFVSVGPPDGLSNVEWLRWYENRHSEGEANAAWRLTRTPPAAEIQQAVAAFRAARPNGPEETARAFMAAVYGVYNGGSGWWCRHYAALAYLAGRELGLDVEWRVHWPGIFPSAKWHCWNRIRIGGRTFVIDCFNDILYEQR